MKPSFSYFSLPTVLPVVISGPHAARYLQARLTNNISSLTDAHPCCLAAALTPQGRTECVVRVRKLDKDSFLLLLEGREPLRSFLRFKVADRFEVTPLKEHTVVHVLGELPKSTVTYWVSLPRTAGIGADLVIPTAGVQTLAGSQLDNPTANYLRFVANSPLFPSELPDDEIFPESALPGYISHTKGCYAGQEVIERIDSRGKAPATLMRVQFIRQPDSATLTSHGQMVGSITASFCYQSCWYGWVWVKSVVCESSAPLDNAQLFSPA